MKKHASWQLAFARTEGELSEYNNFKAEFCKLPGSATKVQEKVYQTLEYCTLDNIIVVTQRRNKNTKKLFNNLNKLLNARYRPNEPKQGFLYSENKKQSEPRQEIQVAFNEYFHIQKINRNVHIKIAIHRFSKCQGVKRFETKKNSFDKFFTQHF